MTRAFATTLKLVLIVLLTTSGCALREKKISFDASELQHYHDLGRGASYADAADGAVGPREAVRRPRTVQRDSVPESWRPLSLKEAIELAVTHSTVMRDLGGTVVRSPVNAKSTLAPGIQSSDPRAGMEAALSAFDAAFSTSAFFEKNDRMLNNFVASGGTRFFQQDQMVFQSQISKLGVAGTQSTLRGTTTYDHNNATFNKFPSAWDTLVDAEIRQPLLQGAGTDFNRIAGPTATPGAINGVVVARINTDISVIDFEAGMRDLVSNVENAYWDLYFAFRDLDAKVAARNASLDLWRRINAMAAAGQAGGTAERESQAREQYFRFEEDVQNALGGRLVESTATNNGSSGGSFRGSGGVLVAERRLRLAIGLPITDDVLLRPADEPTMAMVDFDWDAAVGDAVARRPELQKQRLMVKRRELELLASKNFLLPRLDLVSRYRWRGLGRNLIGGTTAPLDPSDPGNLFGNGSLENLFNGDFQEWQLGAEMAFPVGFRRAHAAVQNAQLQLTRERSVLNEQEQQIVHDLSNAIAELDRTQRVLELSLGRRAATKQQVDILREKLAKDLPVNLDQVLDAERRFADSDVQFQRALVEHTLALRNVHFEKGTLLSYCQVVLAEHFDPQSGEFRSTPPAVARREPTPMNYTLERLGKTVRGEAVRPAIPSHAATPSKMPPATPSTTLASANSFSGVEQTTFIAPSRTAEASALPAPQRLPAPE